MSPEQLAAIHSALAAQLLAKIASGEATSAELSVARQFLKDNDITASADYANNPQSSLRKLGDIVPFKDPEEPIGRTGEG